MSLWTNLVVFALAWQETHWKGEFEDLLCRHGFFPLDGPECLMVTIPVSLLIRPALDIVGWYSKRLVKAYKELAEGLTANQAEVDCLHLLDRGPLSELECALEEVADVMLSPLPDVRLAEVDSHLFVVELNGQQVAPGKYPALQWNAGMMKDISRLIPKPVVVTVHVNGRPARALLDSGSLSDFISVTLVEQLKIPLVPLKKQLTVQLAVQGSCSKVNWV
ncbi:hypothetical protein BU15DRAFT_69192 [Melanogaster broomeanus]|nr:hypothetical protein BU15DRAFT_69192 [Melanogaster broomeanus]